MRSPTAKDPVKPTFVVDISDVFEGEDAGDSLLRVAVRRREGGRRGISHRAKTSMN